MENGAPVVIAMLDVGSPQGLITLPQWKAIAARGVRGVYCRCGNGNNAPDPTFPANVYGARSAGIAAGAYHVGFPLPLTAAHPRRSPEEQAWDHFQASAGLGSLAGELPPALDFEWPMPVDWARWGIDAGFVRGWGLAYLAECARLHGRSPVLYVYPDFAIHVGAGGDMAPFGAYRLWLARYKVAAPGTLAPWAAPTIWQKSDGGGRLPSGAPVDEDVFLGGEEAFGELLAA